MRIWDVKSRAVVAALDSHQGAISCLAFSENGFYMATGAADATVKLWDLRKTKNFHTITPAAGGTISSVQFDYTGTFLTVGSNDVR
jgi:pre-mRNA-processing factor 19